MTSSYNRPAMSCNSKEPMWGFGQRHSHFFVYQLASFWPSGNGHEGSPTEKLPVGHLEKRTNSSTLMQVRIMLCQQLIHTALNFLNNY